MEHERQGKGIEDGQMHLTSLKLLGLEPLASRTGEAEHGEDEGEEDGGDTWELSRSEVTLVRDVNGARESQGKTRGR